MRGSPQISRRLTRSMMAILFVGAITLLLVMGLGGVEPAGLLEAFARAVQLHPIAGRAIYLATFFAAAMLGVIPLSLVALVGGALYGVAGGFLLSAAAALLGAMAAFLLSRYAFRETIHRWLAHHLVLARMDEEMARRGWRLVLLLRFSPTMPFSLTSYALGLTVIRPFSFLLGTFGAFPNLLVIVSTGAFSGRTMEALLNNQAEPGALELVVLAVGLAATGVLSVYLVRIARRAMRGDLDAGQSQPDADRPDP